MVLIQKFVDIEIARKMSLDLTKADLIKESERIDRETKAPERLSDLKKSFGKNRGRYLKNFVLPVLARRLVEEKFWFDTLHYQNEPFRKAKDYLRFMKEDKIKIDTITGFFKVESLESNEEGTNYFFNFIKAIADTVGVKDKTLIKVIEDKTNFYCVIEKRRKKCRYFEGVIVEKKRFTGFYQKQLETIPIKIYNDKIKNKIIFLLKGTYWEKYIGN
ncbi:MAG: hypothetical protein E3J87_05920 [Candidatus Cloacimonadota bacterium]|nr:MAG: hypothetical protein E3J87_05920 [Candidatus Cloacimonadota bacterium]